jgi:NadR type nicotinamide-nucleotide adenylyltransferase
MNKDQCNAGLTIGKFAPLHEGHVDMLRFALKQVDVLYVIVYDAPDKTNIPLSKRAGWIKEIFKDERVIIIEGINAPNIHEDTQEVRSLQEAYIGKVVKSIKLTHFISSESYGDHLSKHLGIENIIYDQKRHNRMISSTMIREDFDQYKNQLPGVVLKDVIKEYR